MGRRSQLGLLAIVFGTLVFFIFNLTAAALSANFSRSYNSDGTIPIGSIVSLDSERQNYVQPANTNNGLKLIGVIVNANDSLIAADVTPGKVQVATSGNASTLVSTLNGDIHIGDQIGVSTLSGVGMKAQAGSRVIGLAQTAFDSHTEGAKAQKVTDSSGKTVNAYIGYVKVGVAVSTKNTEDANVNSLQKALQSFTGHIVSMPRIIISILITLVAFIVLITLTYTSIYSSIISVGRNPLAKYAVFRTLRSILAMTLLTTILASVAVYMLLK